MEGVDLVVIGRSPVNDPVNLELCIADTVGYRAHAGSEEPLARRGYIVLDIVVADHDILIVPVLVRCEDGHYPGSEIGNLEGHVSALDSV